MFTTRTAVPYQKNTATDQVANSCHRSNTIGWCYHLAVAFTCSMLLPELLLNVGTFELFNVGAHLHRSASGRLLSQRIWLSHLFLGWPGAHFKVPSGTRPRQMSIWRWRAWCAGVSFPSLAIDKLKWRHSK